MHNEGNSMKDIFQMQMKLNERTLGNIGIEFGEILADEEKKCLWLENYRKALSSELAELVREVQEKGLGSRNGKIEVVDILHFLVSLSQVLGISDEEALELCVESGPPSFYPVVIASFLALDELQNSVKWKWWAKGGGFKREKARNSVGALWSCFQSLCTLFDMNGDKVKKIYMDKNRVNFMRQAKGYDEDKKSEEDNESIST